MVVLPWPAESSSFEGSCPSHLWFRYQDLYGFLSL